MSIDQTRRDIAQRAEELRALAGTLPAERRADLLLETVRAIYLAVSIDHPEGQGLDGMGGPERTSLAAVVDAAQDHQHATYARVSATGTEGRRAP